MGRKTVKIHDGNRTAAMAASCIGMVVVCFSVPPLAFLAPMALPIFLIAKMHSNRVIRESSLMDDTDEDMIIDEWKKTKRGNEKGPE